ncbi:hypothetical protein M408DRAFT_73764 [Serendipita vermifera MAFF 305830]|uniref:Uncharacterized protein n=1 Tax=Serendipita vermifera MAFF 305830 TaxID=933852 RepID=A0A0C3AMF0_SERVB|nr:hypothetical protein M408DRAFT_73764 [Serendipita vermifera MAFF 305830]
MSSTLPVEKGKQYSSGFLQHKNRAKAVHTPDSKSEDDTHTAVTSKDDAPGAHKDKPSDPIPMVPFFSLFRFHRPYEIALNFIGIVCAIASGSAQPLMTLMFGNLTVAFVNFGTAAQIAFQEGATPEALQALQDAAQDFRNTASKDAMYLTFIGVGMFVCTYIYMVIWVRTSEVAAKRLRENYLRAILRQNVAFFDNVGAGEVATRIQTDTHLVHQGISEKVPVALSFLSAFLTGFALAYARSWKLSLAISSIIPCIALTGALMNIFMAKYKREQLGYVAGGGSLAEEIISTIRTAQAFGTQKVLASLYDVYLQKTHQLGSKLAVIQGASVAFFFFVIYSAYGLAFHFGTTLILNHEIDVGVIVNCILSIIIGSISLAFLAPEVIAISTARGAAAKLFETIDRVPPIDSASPAGLKPDPKSIRGEIAFHNVRFNYPSRPEVPILRGIDLIFPAGQTTALVGASGSGKSTIVSLVERFYDPLSGSVKLDDLEIRDLNIRWLRGQIGLVSQEPTLFATSIRGNVEHGMIGTDMETLGDQERLQRVTEACIKSNAHDFITALPDGYNTLVGERGFLLSGGQKQRIAIARAIVSDPKVLLLDEATSALDTRSEEVVQNALDKASKGRTTITIAHRLSTIKDAAKIYVMGDGMILEEGTHQQLLDNAQGPYAKLVTAQKLKGVWQTEGNDSSALQTPSGTPSHTDLGGTVVEKRSVLEETRGDDALSRKQSLGRKDSTKGSVRDVIQHQENQNGAQEEEYGIFYIIKRMIMINRDSWLRYMVGLLGSLGGGMVYPVFGIVFGHAINAFQYTGHELRVQGDRAALWFFIIAIAATIAITLQNASYLRATNDLVFRLRNLMFRAILRQDIAYFDEDKHSTGVLTSSLSQNPEKISGLGGATLGAIVQSVTTVVGGSIVGLCYGWKLSLIGIACIPLVISAGYIRLRVVVMKDQTNRRTHAESAQVACEAAGAIKTVASLTREDDCLQIYSKSLEMPLKLSNRSAIHSTLWFALSQSMSFFVIALVFWFGSRLVADFEYDTLQFFVCLMSITFGSVQAGNVFMHVPDISQSHIAGSEIITLLDSVPEVDSESTNGKMISKMQGHICLKDVEFCYPTRPTVRVLRNFDLVVEPGTHVALVGASGSGKSTIIQLIERFYDPISGTILVDGQAINELNVQEYRKHISLVSQEPTLYSGTVRFNILLGAIKPHDQVTQEEIEAACRDANILDFINSLPDGFETEVGGKGNQLSGGQKQRIAIARALLRNPSILLLDEATSALDSNSERVVQDALDRAAKGRTTISIAHRLSSIQKCDHIYFVSEGRIVESGTHDELLHLQGQ